MTAPTAPGRLAEIERRLAAADNGYGAFSMLRAEMDALVEFAKTVRDELDQPNPTTAAIAQALDTLEES